MVPTHPERPAACTALGLPHVAVIVVLPPCGNTVAVAPVKLAKYGSTPSEHCVVMSFLPDIVTP